MSFDSPEMYSHEYWRDIEIDRLRRDFNSDSMVRIRPGMNKFESSRYYLEIFTGKRPKDTDSISLQEPFDPLPKNKEI